METGRKFTGRYWFFLVDLYDTTANSNGKLNWFLLGMSSPVHNLNKFHKTVYERCKSNDWLIGLVILHKFRINGMA